MNELDILTERVHHLAQSAPVPVVDPMADVRRGRAALRRRRARMTAGATVTLLAVGGVVATVTGVQEPSRVSDTGIPPASAPSARSSGPAAATTQAPRRNPLCAQGEVSARSDGRVSDQPPWEDSSIAPVLASYRQAAIAILDPDGRHLEGAKVSNVQYGCGSGRLTELGTKLGWRSGVALGLVQLEVAPHQQRDELQVVLAHGHWTPYDGNLPDGITAARVAAGDGGLAVVAEREDGLTVAVDTQGVWGNNMPPGSASATDLPGVGKLLTLAASPQLTFPEG